MEVLDDSSTIEAELEAVSREKEVTAGWFLLSATVRKSAQRFERKDRVEIYQGLRYNFYTGGVKILHGRNGEQ